ncbi:LPD7 domain-containing protein [Brevundimonas diminuta]|uniref:LPD7 domain-containing protein n=1 Tax=Brevundimonas diminuta TaxID=293 RepID=UPI003D9A8441
MTEPAPSHTNPDGTNQLGPARARPREVRSWSVAKGDVPQSLLDRYLVERDLRGRPEHFYRDHRTPDPAFRDRGRKLSSDRPYPDTIADMLKVAQHRGWNRLKVEGAESFRREVWVQARAMGLEVHGYRPRGRDREAAGLPHRRLQLEDRLRKASIVVRTLIADPEAQQRVIAQAAARIGLLHSQAHDNPSRSRDQTRVRGGR